jgi:hypothetical protein
MTWIDAPAAWAADRPVDAHITTTLQAQLQAVHDSSGSDLSGGLLSDGAIKLAPTSAVTWAWSDLIPRPVRCLRAQGDTGWRPITVEILGILGAPGKTTVRAFPAPSRGMLVSTAGDATPDSIDSADLEWTDAVTAARVSGTVTPTIVGATVARGIVVPIVWLKMAIMGDQDLSIYDVRITEEV